MNKFIMFFCFWRGFEVLYSSVFMKKQGNKKERAPRNLYE